MEAARRMAQRQMKSPRGSRDHRDVLGARSNRGKITVSNVPQRKPITFGQDLQDLMG
jgi:hypothetical protein